ncbi:syndecan-like [Portunus trituberculatus]|uniref:syndecan-like n=1 Tax=Portunus trituberculatus TaxID=210409 RepID=UPI001E1D1F05|nr:syndecan-like [Portunus trituberculatus]
MRIPSLLLACTLLLGPLTRTQVLASSSSSKNTDDLYLDDFGSGEGPEGLPEVTLTHLDHEGSGYGPGNDRSPYGAVYDYDDTEDDYDDYAEGIGEEVIIEGSGVFIDVDDSDREPEVKEEVIVKEGTRVNEAPPPPPASATTPPPTMTDRSGRGNVESPFQIHTTMTEERQVSIFAQPGILAAFIGGAVVGLLCAILLVMFIVYRMRKKDEGSYPLDEPKRMPLTSSYSPNDKEIYA